MIKMRSVQHDTTRHEVYRTTTTISSSQPGKIMIPIPLSNNVSVVSVIVLLFTLFQVTEGNSDLWFIP